MKLKRLKSMSINIFFIFSEKTCLQMALSWKVRNEVNNISSLQATMIIFKLKTEIFQLQTFQHETFYVYDFRNTYANYTHVRSSVKVTFFCYLESKEY